VRIAKAFVANFGDHIEIDFFLRLTECSTRREQKKTKKEPRRNLHVVTSE
jgi:hypothetical protein